MPAHGVGREQVVMGEHEIAKATLKEITPPSTAGTMAVEPALPPAKG